MVSLLPNYTVCVFGTDLLSNSFHESLTRADA